MLTGEIIQQVFMIKQGNGCGTAFTVIVDGRQYLVTARHVVEDASKAEICVSTTLLIFHAQQWKPLECPLVGLGADPYDIAVFGLPQMLTKYDPIELGSKGLTYSQDVYFLGFPYLLRGNFGAMNNDYPLPYAKRAIVSMINGKSIEHQLLILDGHNNSGFSGGPVVFQDINAADKKWRIAAVISGFNSVREPVYVGDSEAHSDFTIEQNTGLIYACPMDIGIEMIKANPIGCLVK